MVLCLFLSLFITIWLLVPSFLMSSMIILGNWTKTWLKTTLLLYMGYFIEVLSLHSYISRLPLWNKVLLGFFILFTCCLCNVHSVYVLPNCLLAARVNLLSVSCYVVRKWHSISAINNFTYVLFILKYVILTCQSAWMCVATQVCYFNLHFPWRIFPLSV